MDKELFLAFVLYFNSKTFPPTFSLNDRRSLRRKTKQCQFIDGRLFCGGRRILLSDEIEDHLRSFLRRSWGHILPLTDRHTRHRSRAWSHDLRILRAVTRVDCVPRMSQRTYTRKYLFSL